MLRSFEGIYDVSNQPVVIYLDRSGLLIKCYVHSYVTFFWPRVQIVMKLKIEKEIRRVQFHAAS